MNSEKVVGYLLIVVGLGIIFFALFTASQIFSGSKSPPALFRMEKSSKPISIGGVEMPGLEFIPIEYLNLSGNLTFFLLFMWLLLSAGGRVASIGVGMISIKTAESVKEKQPSRPESLP
jgi:hypothetical protein